MSDDERAERETALLVAQEARVRALLAGDLAALDRVVSDDLVYIAPTGKIRTKPQVFESFRAGTLKIERMDCDEMSARLYGPVGILCYRAASRILDDGVTYEGRTRATAVYHHQDGRWQLVLQHVCALE